MLRKMRKGCVCVCMSLLGTITLDNTKASMSHPVFVFLTLSPDLFLSPNACYTYEADSEPSRHCRFQPSSKVVIESIKSNSNLNCTTTLSTSTANLHNYSIQYIILTPNISTQSKKCCCQFAICCSHLDMHTLLPLPLTMFREDQEQLQEMQPQPLQHLACRQERKILKTTNI